VAAREFDAAARRRGPKAEASGALDAAARRWALEAAASGELDVLIVGGGITGAGAALDAATRGLRVGLVEARDLASGTSSASSKLIHGGLRYLEMGDLRLVREALRERELLLTRIAPHLVEPVPFLWPLRGRGWERAYLGAGLVLYDSLGGARSVPRHRHLSRRGALAVAPALRDDALVGAVQFHDALEDDARMVAVVARTAAAHGAAIATRVRVTGFRGPGEVEALDEETGETLVLRARHVASAAGAWTDRVRELARGRSAWRNVPSKGIHVFVPRERIPMQTGVLARTEKSVLFVIPWQGGWLIGDTDTPWSGAPDRPVATGADVDYLLAKTNALLAEPLRRDDVHGVTAGLRPLVAEAARSDTTSISRRHVVESPAPGLTTIAGGKYTTYRVMAADLIDAVARALGVGARSVTRDVPLLGAEGARVAAAEGRRPDVDAAEGRRPDVDAVEGRLVARYGSSAAELAALIAARPELAEPLAGGEGHLRAEVVHACTHEGALHLEDVLERRTRLALTARDRGLRAAAPAAELMAGVLDWSPERTLREVESWRARVAAARAGEAEREDGRALEAYRGTLAERADAAVRR
jgi:glycerol-3-phosphate dehydrogenase